MWAETSLRMATSAEELEKAIASAKDTDPPPNSKSHRVLTLVSENVAHGGSSQIIARERESRESRALFGLGRPAGAGPHP